MCPVRNVTYVSGRTPTHPSRSLGRESRYDAIMTKDQVKEILDRGLTWPPERQADVAHVVELMEKQDNSTLRLSEEQAAEVRRRLADENAKTVTLAEFNDRLRRRYGV
jgi:hypothetical protein